MSRHIIHIIEEGSYLFKERGFLVCRKKDRTEKRTPIGDIKALIIACQSTCLSTPSVRYLLENKAVILHCDGSFRPVGITLPLSNVITKEATFGQIDPSEDLKQALWYRVLLTKINNQIALLNHIGCDTRLLTQKTQEKPLNESICARLYFQRLFPYLTNERLRRRKDHEHPINKQLNYGYAVLSAMCHRSIAAHGLLAQLGLQHKSRYRSHPLVYDLMECLRPFIDACLVFFYQQQQAVLEGEGYGLTNWCRWCATDLYHKKIASEKGITTLLEAIDLYIMSLCVAFSSQKSERLWTPAMSFEREENLEGPL